MVSKVKSSPSVTSRVEWKWNHIASPEVRSRAATAPVRGQGLGSTIWNACAWCAIRRSLVSIGLVTVRIRMLELLQRQVLTGLVRIIR